MYKKYFLLIALAVAFVSCKTKIEYEDKYVPVLQVSNIYSTDSVKAYMDQYKDAHKELAESYLKQAKEFATSNPERSLYAVKRAITLYPIRESYLLLVEKLSGKNDVDELENVYRILCRHDFYDRTSDSYSYLFGKPDTKLMYAYFLFCAMNNQYFYTDPEEMDRKEMQAMLIKEPRLTMDRGSTAFLDILLRLLSYEEIRTYAANPNVFTGFLRSIPDSSAELNIDEKNIAHFRYATMEESNNEGEDGGFYSSKTAANTYLYETQADSNAYINVNFLKRYPLNNNVTVLLYSVDSSAPACPINMRHIYYRIATYTSNAKLIDHKVIASQAGEVFNTVSGNKNSLTVTENRRRWERPYNLNDFDNEVAEVDKIRSTTYSIDESGKIIAVTQP
jgi:hypothetical protein